MTNNNHTEDYEVVKPMAKFDDGLEFLMMHVLQLPLDNPIPLAIYQAGVTTWQQFMFMDEDDVFDIDYWAEDGTSKFLTKYEQKLLSWFIGYVRSNIDNNVPGSDEPSFYTKEDFTKYTQDRRKLSHFRTRYIATRKGCDEHIKTLEGHVVDLANKVTKKTTEILEQLKKEAAQRKQSMNKQKVPAPQPAPAAAAESGKAEAAAPSA